MKIVSGRMLDSSPDHAITSRGRLKSWNIYTHAAPRRLVKAAEKEKIVKPQLVPLTARKNLGDCLWRWICFKTNTDVQITSQCIQT